MTPDTAAALREATGCDDPEVQEWLLSQARDIEAIAGGPGADFPEEQARRTVGLLRAVMRGRTAEALVSSQMLGLHRQVMASMRRTAEPDMFGTSIVKELALTHRLATLVTRQAEYLRRCRQARDAAATVRTAAGGTGPARSSPDAPGDGGSPPGTRPGGQGEAGETGAQDGGLRGGEAPPHPPHRARDGSPPSPPPGGGVGQMAGPDEHGSRAGSP